MKMHECVLPVVPLGIAGPRYKFEDAPNAGRLTATPFHPALFLGEVLKVSLH